MDWRASANIGQKIKYTTKRITETRISDKTREVDEKKVLLTSTER